jgi:membrane-associated phospholipid phosphatase
VESALAVAPHPLRTGRSRSPRERSRGAWLAAALLAGLALAGCATLPRGHGWGEAATLRPGWRRIRDAAAHAALAPQTWVPAAGALALQIHGRDRALSAWAVDHAPVFHSAAGAHRASRSLLRATTAAYVVTALATPGDRDPARWLWAKARGFAVGAGAAGVTEGMTLLLKEGTQRRRPDRSDRLSFPSGHASSAAVRATLAVRNLETIRMPRGARWALQGSAQLLAAGTAWSRVEGNLHYPSDVLAGMALGSFIGAFVNDAFLGGSHGECREGTGGDGSADSAGRSAAHISMAGSTAGAGIALRWSF